MVKEKYTNEQTNKQNRQYTYNPSPQDLQKVMELVFAQWPVDKVPYRHRDMSSERLWHKEEVTEL